MWFKFGAEARKGLPGQLSMVCNYPAKLSVILDRVPLHSRSSKLGRSTCVAPYNIVLKRKKSPIGLVYVHIYRLQSHASHLFDCGRNGVDLDAVLLLESLCSSFLVAWGLNTSTLPDIRNCLC